MKKHFEFFAVWFLYLAFLICAGFLFVRCTPATTEPSAPELEVIGRWAGAGTVAGTAVQITMEYRTDKTYAAAIDVATAPAQREAGTWRRAGAHVVTAPATCEAADDVGGVLRLVACSGPDSIPVNITGGTWRLSLPAGGAMVTFDLVRQ